MSMQNLELSQKIDTDNSLKRLQRLGFWSFLILAAVGGYWTFFAKLNGAVIAHATIVAESFTKKVQHRDGGIIQKILVRDGDRIESGTTLVELDPTETRAELGIVDGLYDEALIKRARLEAQRDGSRTMILPESIEQKASEPEIARNISGQDKLLVSTSDAVKAKREQLESQIAQLEEQITGLDAQLKAKKSQLKLIRDELVSLKKLQNQGLTATSRVLAVEREAASLAGQEGELIASRASAMGRIGEVKLEIIQIEEQNRNQALTELREVEQKITELRERRISAGARLQRMTIKAPITGTIYQMAVHTEGGVITPGETLMLVVPEGDDLVLQAQVQPNDVDQVIQGQMAQVRFPGFNARLTPEIGAEVVQVAADTTRVDQNTPPFYAVRLRIPPDQLSKLGENKLRPGMSAEAFIQTEARTPAWYLIQPLWEQVFSRAMHES
jgi:HlyD family secretion protein